MPFDSILSNTETTSIETPTIKHDLNTCWGRLRHLADRIENLPDWWKLDMSTYEKTCGSVGCALGFASHLPEFQEKGMKAFPLNYVLKGDDRRNRHHLRVDDCVRVWHFHSMAFFGFFLSSGNPISAYTAKWASECFGGGGQFSHLGRPITGADVARNLRNAAREMEGVYESNYRVQYGGTRVFRGEERQVVWIDEASDIPSDF